MPAASPASPGLVAVGLVRHLGGRRIVDQLSLSVAPGEIVGLLGPNGAGKTTTFRLLVGLDAPDAGTITLDGAPLRGPLWARVRAGLGYLPQEISVLRRMSARDNLLVALEARGAPAAEADALLARLGLAALADRPAGGLSGGERRRLELGRCLATAPRIVLLDEPFAGVDPVAIAELQRHILEMAEAGVGVLLTDHAVHEALPLCDRALLLDGGAVLVEGSPAAVAADPHARRRYLGPNFELRPRTKIS